MTTDQSAAAAALDALASRLAGLGLGAGVDDRQAVLPDPLRGFHRRLLGAFLTQTGPPDRTVVARLAEELDPRVALATLAAADLVHTDLTTGSISVAYPFSGRPTPHRVELAGGPTVFAMCALDALGIPQMLRRDGRISSVDPASGQPITVEVKVHDRVWRFRPPTTVLLAGTIASGDACGVVADCCCPYINFHIDPRAADAYRTAHSGMAGELFGKAEAVEAARRVFGGLLDPPNAQE